MDPDDTASGENTDDLDESLNPNAQPDSTAAPPPSQSQQQQQQKHHQTQLGINDEAQREMISSFLSGSQCLNGVNERSLSINLIILINLTVEI
jgi:hypothetical protein